MSHLKVDNLILFEGQHEVLILTKNEVQFEFRGEFLILAKNVSKALEYSRTEEVTKFCKKEQVHIVKNGDLSVSAKNRIRKLNNAGEAFITNLALNRVFGKSEKPKAEPFQDWLYEEMLPSVQKHGAYMTPDTLDNIISDPDFGIKLLTTLKEEKEKRVQAERAIQQANLVIEQQKPKVVYAEAVEVSEDTVLVKDLAAVLTQKGVKIGEIRLFKWLRENGYLCKQKGDMWNMPTQRSLELGVIVVKHGLRTGNNGEMKKTRTPKITGKGQVYFVNKILKEAGLLVV